MEYFKNLLNIQIISYDKMNQLRHVRYLKDKETTLALMRRHAAILGPKFRTVEDELDRHLSPLRHRPVEPSQGRLFRQSGRHARNRQAGAGVVPGRRRHHDRRWGPPSPMAWTPGQQHPHCPSLPPIHELEQAIAILCDCRVWRPWALGVLAAISSAPHAEGCGAELVKNPFCQAAAGKFGCRGQLLRQEAQLPQAVRQLTQACSSGQDRVCRWTPSVSWDRGAAPSCGS